MAETALHRLRHALTDAMRGPAVRARFAAVLDGRTLNLDLPLPGAASVALVRGRARHLVDIRHGGDGVAATMLLTGLEPGGAWLLEAVADGTTYAILPGLGKEPEGPTVANPPDPVTGFRYELGATRTGRLGITVVAPGPTAEVAAIGVDWLEAYVEIRLLGGEGPATAMEFTARTGEGRIVSTMTGPRCDLPVRDMALLGGAKETFFDVRVRAGDQRLRVGRFLHDVANPKNVLVPPAGIVWAGNGLPVHVRPYYTPSGNLTIACRPIGSAPQDGSPQDGSPQDGSPQDGSPQDGLPQNGEK